MFDEVIHADEIGKDYGYGIVSFRVGAPWGIGYTKDVIEDEDTGSRHWEILPHGEVEPAFIGFDDPDIFVGFTDGGFVMAGKCGDDWALYTSEKERLGTFPSKQEAIAAAKPLLSDEQQEPVNEVFVGHWGPHSDAKEKKESQKEGS